MGEDIRKEKVTPNGSPAPSDEDNETNRLYLDDGNGMGDMVLHIKNLEIFFNLYIPSLTEMQKAVLKDCLIELYNKFNIYWDTDISKLSNIDFPVFSDLYKLVIGKADIKKSAKKESETNIYADLACLLKDIAEGSDSFLWNGHSTLQTNTNCICLDTHDLQNTSDNVKRTQYFNILTWCWEQMSRNRTERVLLIADEAYLMIDPNVPQSLVFLRNVAKRARKYEAGIAIISHSVVDFLDPQIKMYGQALLDIPCFKILMGCDGKNLQETKELYNLTEAKNQNGGSNMKKINLRDLYPFYKSDFLIEIADEVAELIKQIERKEHADYERIRVNKAYYSLDADDGIERGIVLLVLSPEEIYERKLSKQELYAAINSLPEKQAKRIYAHFFLGMSKAKIARIEGVNKCQVSRSIEKALKNIEKFLKKFL